MLSPAIFGRIVYSCPRLATRPTKPPTKTQTKTSTKPPTKTPTKTSTKPATKPPTKTPTKTQTKTRTKPPRKPTTKSHRQRDLDEDTDEAQKPFRCRPPSRNQACRQAFVTMRLPTERKRHGLSSLATQDDVHQRRSKTRWKCKKTQYFCNNFIAII